MLLLVTTAFAIRWPEFHRAIVVATEVPARSAPASAAAESFALRAGESVTVSKTYGQFILVRTTDGRSGWVSKKKVGLVFMAARPDRNSASSSSLFSWALIGVSLPFRFG
jgi:SH3-like domain-containing protein